MKILHKLRHLLIPHESNNHKAKILHNSSLFLIVFSLIAFQLVIGALGRIGPSVLGYAANISPDEVIRLTNEKRAANGLAPLTLNGTLSAAAQAKGADMINKDYWAHVGPDGTQPWKFFTDFGYKYRYAGENLARDFSNAASAVDAWMASPSHKENMLSPKYKEIGIGVVEGDMAGVDTTIIVQFFGTTMVDTIPITPVAQTKTTTPAATPQALVLATPIATPIATSELTQITTAPKEVSNKVLISPFNTTKSVSFIIVGVLLGVLVVDLVITRRRRIVRIGGRTFAHLAFFGMVLAILLILKAGRVL